ncbi:MAG: ABC transporter ATP-binding protein [Mobilitalea sp.]
MLKKPIMNSLLEEYRVFWDAAKINFNISPSLTLLTALNAFFDAVRPLVTAFLSSLIINNIIEGIDYHKIVYYIIITVISQFVLNLAVRYTDNRSQLKKNIWSNMCANYLYEISNQMDYEYFENPRIKEIYSRISNANNNGEGLAEINELIKRFVDCTTKIITSFSLLASILLSVPDREQKGILAIVNTPYIILIFLILLLVKTFGQGKINALMSKKAYSLWGYAAKPTMLFDRLYSLSTDYKNGMDLRIFREQEIITEQTHNFMTNPFDTERITRTWTLNAIFQHLIDTVFIAFQYFVVVAKAISGAVGIGNLVLYTQTLSSFSNGVLGFTGLFVELKSNNRFIRDLFTYINLPNKMRSGTRHVEDGNYMVEFRNVSFQYPFTDQYVLKDVNIKFHKGDHINVVGVNGSGKTTFVKLLCRLYDPSEGEILLNGINIKEYIYDEYTALFSVVFQDFKLFAFTIGQNVATSNEYNRNLTLQYLKKAGFGELKNMQHGTETFLYKNFVMDGVEISGGEAQKIAIARSLYKEAPFIILDEPTAALDPIAEYDIFTNFQYVVEDKTAICISHRLSSCRICDRIIVFDNCKIIQVGTHEELVRSEGQYKTLWNAQAQYYQDDSSSQTGFAV